MMIIFVHKSRILLLQLGGFIIYCTQLTTTCCYCALLCTIVNLVYLKGVRWSLITCWLYIGRRL